MDCLGAEERRGEVRGVEALLWGGVAEGAVFGCGVAVPAAGGQAGGVVAEEGRGLPGVDLGGDGGGEVGALVDYPADCLGGRGTRGEEAGTEGGIRAGAAEDVVDWGFGREEFDLVWEGVSDLWSDRGTPQVDCTHTNDEHAQCDKVDLLVLGDPVGGHLGLRSGPAPVFGALVEMRGRARARVRLRVRVEEHCREGQVVAGPSLARQ